jgi:hypothetical protein
MIRSSGLFVRICRQWFDDFFCEIGTDGSNLVHEFPFPDSD